MTNPENSSKVENSSRHATINVDATELKCPMPLLKMKQALNNAAEGDIVVVKATDPASQRDFSAYLQTTQHELSVEMKNGIFSYKIVKH